MSISLKPNWNDYYCLNAIKDCTIIYNNKLIEPKYNYNKYGCIIDKFDSNGRKIYTIAFPYPSFLLGDNARNIWEDILYRFPYNWVITRIPADQFYEGSEWQIEGNINNIIEEINEISDQFITILKEKIENNEIKGMKSDLLQTIDFTEYNYEKAKKSIQMESSINNSMIKEGDLVSKKDSPVLDDLFSKSSEEIVDGLVQAADGDHELALINLEQYMNTHDGFNRNILTAHQQLQNKVESMKNSKISNMIDEALSDLQGLENLDRQEQINQIVRHYVVAYTCGEMADRLSDVIAEEKEANEYLEKKIAEMNITKEELNIALDLAYDEMVNQRHTAFIYDTKYFK